MAASLEEVMISYEELSDLEHEFDEVETEISEFRDLDGLGLDHKRLTQVST